MVPGKLDKNGVEIFEKDIIKKHFGASDPIIVVEYHNEKQMFVQNDQYGHNIPLYELPSRFIEVIGNTYENKNLLPKLLRMEY